MLRDSKFSEELEQLKTKEPADDDDGGDDGDGVGSPMDALDLLKKVRHSSLEASRMGHWRLFQARGSIMRHSARSCAVDGLPYTP